MPRYLVEIEGKVFDIELAYRGDRYLATVDGSEIEINRFPLTDQRSLYLIDGRSHEIDIHADGYDAGRTVFMHGIEISASIEDYNLAQLRRRAGISKTASGDNKVTAPMPGLILEVKVSEGENVSRGQPLMIIEAMKMENVVKSPCDGQIKTIFAEASQSVEKGDKLIELA